MSVVDKKVSIVDKKVSIVDKKVSMVKNKQWTRTMALATHSSGYTHLSTVQFQQFGSVKCQRLDNFMSAKAT